MKADKTKNEFVLNHMTQFAVTCGDLTRIATRPFSTMFEPELFTYQVNGFYTKISYD